MNSKPLATWEINRKRATQETRRISKLFRNAHPELLDAKVVSHGWYGHGIQGFINSERVFFTWDEVLKEVEKLDAVNELGEVTDLTPAYKAPVTENAPARVARYEIEVKTDNFSDAKRLVDEAIAEAGFEYAVATTADGLDQNVAVVDLPTTEIGRLEPALSIRRQISGWSLRILDF